MADLRQGICTYPSPRQDVLARLNICWHLHSVLNRKIMFVSMRGPGVRERRDATIGRSRIVLRAHVGAARVGSVQRRSAPRAVHAITVVAGPIVQRYIVVTRIVAYVGYGIQSPAQASSLGHICGVDLQILRCVGESQDVRARRPL